MKSYMWLPILSMLSGFTGLFVDFKNGTSQWRWLVPAFIVLTTGGSIIASMQSDQAQALDNAVKVQKYKDDLAAAQQGVNNHTDDRIDDLKRTILGLSGAKQDVVSTASNSVLNESVHASQLKQQVLASLPREGAGSLQITYFPHFEGDVNIASMVAALKQVSPNVAQAPAVANMSEQKTNCIWVGQNVSPDEAQAVALTLTGAGIAVKDIRRLKNGDGSRSRLIQIGSSVDASRMPTLTADQIRARNLPPVAGGNS
jgi:hypothetical protein